MQSLVHIDVSFVLNTPNHILLAVCTELEFFKNRKKKKSNKNSEETRKCWEKNPCRLYKILINTKRFKMRRLLNDCHYIITP